MPWWTFDGDLNASEFVRLVHWFRDNWDHVDGLFRQDNSKTQGNGLSKFVRVEYETLMPSGEVQWTRLGFPVSPTDWGVQIIVHFRDLVSKTRFHLETGIT